MKKLAILVTLFAYYVVCDANPARAASELELWCLSQGETWSTGDSACNVDGNASIGSDLAIVEGETLIIDGLVYILPSVSTIMNDGTINNQGRFWNFGSNIPNDGTFSNNGSVENFNGGTIENSPGSDGGTIVNGEEGHFINYQGAELLNGAGCVTCTIQNSGIIDNAGRLESEDSAIGEILNEGTINNSGLLRIGTGIANVLNNASSGVIDNELGGSITVQANGTHNDGLINNSGTFTIGAGVELTNDGTIYNRCEGHFENNGTLLGQPVAFEICSTVIDGEAGCESIGASWYSDTCTIASLDVPSGITITIAGGIRIVVAGYLTNAGTIANSGTIEVGDFATFTNQGFIENFSGGTIQNTPGSTGGTIENGEQGHIVNHLGAELLNGAGCATCTIQNSGILDNEGDLKTEDSAIGEILNEGTINNSGSLRIGTGIANVLNNASSGVINNALVGSIAIDGGVFTNDGIITNHGGISNSGYFLNRGALRNWGIVDNSIGTVNNEGVIWQYLSGTWIGLPPEGNPVFYAFYFVYLPIVTNDG